MYVYLHILSFKFETKIKIEGRTDSVVGHADLLIFPNIESGNTFYKTVSLFGDANMAGMLRGTTSPVAVSYTHLVPVYRFCRW